MYKSLSLFELLSFSRLFQRELSINLVRKERLELSRVTPLEPKSSASTNSATFATGMIIQHRIQFAAFTIFIIKEALD